MILPNIIVVLCTLLLAHVAISCEAGAAVTQVHHQRWNALSYEYGNAYDHLHQRFMIAHWFLSQQCAGSILTALPNMLTQEANLCDHGMFGCEALALLPTSDPDREVPAHVIEICSRLLSMSELRPPS